jgi:hypothetical protein
MVMGYVEYTLCDNRVDIAWVTDWGSACGHEGLSEKLLRHALSEWDASGIPNTQTTIRMRKKDPTWMLAKKMNMFYSAGFVMQYWISDNGIDLSYRMHRKHLKQ